MNELWSRSLAKIYDGKREDFKRLAEDLLSAIREYDSETLNYAIFLDEPGRVAVIIEQYASAAGWVAHQAELQPPTPRLPGDFEVTHVAGYCVATLPARPAHHPRCPN